MYELGIRGKEKQKRTRRIRTEEEIKAIRPQKETTRIKLNAQTKKRTKQNKKDPTPNPEGRKPTEWKRQMVLCPRDT